MRAEQDREYRQAAEADQRERLRKQEEREQQQRDEEEREREEEARIQEEETQAAIALSNDLHRQSSIERIRKQLAPEPPVSPNVAVIRFQLPEGTTTKLTRRFQRLDTVQVLRDFLSLHFFDSSSAVTNFGLSTNYPVVELTDDTITLEAAVRDWS